MVFWLVYTRSSARKSGQILRTAAVRKEGTLKSWHDGRNIICAPRSRKSKTHLAHHVSKRKVIIGTDRIQVVQDTWYLGSRIFDTLPV